MFSRADRERIRSELLESARADTRLTGGALTGSAAAGAEDPWSDIDLAFGVGDGTQLLQVLTDWTAHLYDRYQALHHFDVHAGAWVYRVFLLESTLQVDLAFVPAEEFAARAPTFRLMFGRTTERRLVPPPDPETLVGFAWLYALHARSSLARGRLWQAEYMVSAMRDQVLALACVRHDLPARDGRGMDRLPMEVTQPLEGGLIGRLDTREVSRSFRVIMRALLAEVGQMDGALASRLESALLELSGDGPA